jgi:hypothetical protein
MNRTMMGQDMIRETLEFTIQALDCIKEACDITRP